MVVPLLGWSGSTARLAVVPLSDVFVFQQRAGRQWEHQVPSDYLAFRRTIVPGVPGSGSTTRALVVLDALLTQRRQDDHTFAILYREVLWGKDFRFG